MWASRLASVAIHAVLIGAAIRFSERPVVPREEIGIAPPLFLPADPSRPPSPPAPGTSSLNPAPHVRFDPHSIPSEIPPIGAELPRTFLPPGDPGLPGADSLNLLPGGTPIVTTAVIDARVADEAPRLLTHPPLHYPEVLRQAGIEARVVVEAVLDTLGRVERGSARVTSGAHALFDEQARALVEGSRYAAARYAGRAVRVRVAVPVVFALRR